MIKAVGVETSTILKKNEPAFNSHIPPSRNAVRVTCRTIYRTTRQGKGLRKQPSEGTEYAIRKTSKEQTLARSKRGKRMRERIQLKRTKGWRLPPDARKVARPSRWGNPYKVEVFGLDTALKLFTNTMRQYWNPDDVPEELSKQAYTLHCEFVKKNGPDVLTRAKWDLQGYDLACYCSLDSRCHADILLNLVNGLI